MIVESALDELNEDWDGRSHEERHAIWDDDMKRDGRSNRGGEWQLKYRRQRDGASEEYNRWERRDREIGLRTSLDKKNEINGKWLEGARDFLNFTNRCIHDLHGVMIDYENEATGVPGLRSSDERIPANRAFNASMYKAMKRLNDVAIMLKNLLNRGEKFDFYVGGFSENQLEKAINRLYPGQV